METVRMCILKMYGGQAEHAKPKTNVVNFNYNKLENRLPNIGSLFL